MLETVIRGTHSISEYKQAKNTLEELTQKAYEKHRQLVQWTHGEPIRARYNDVTGYLQVVYSDSATYEYNSQLEPFEVAK